MTTPNRPFEEAVRFFWETRERQESKQKEKGGSDQGSRSAVTGGKQMDGFIKTIEATIISAGVDPRDIYTREKTTLPGFYRPTKEWDILVVTKGILLAAIELKSQVGPSFGNNFNNRTEEALGVATDTWTAFRQGAYGATQPWLGYLFLLEDCPRSRLPVEVSEPHFLVFPEFKAASYAKRYELFCRKLVLERQYSAACFILADKNKAREPDNYSEPLDELSGDRFLASLYRHVRQ